MLKRSALISALAVLALPALAQSHWGPNNECAAGHEEELNHCYAVEHFRMNGSTEYAEGEATGMTTERCEAFNFGEINDEMWVSFPGEAEYIEAGQTCMTGEPNEIHQFYASTKPDPSAPEGYYQSVYTAPWTVPMNTRNWYEIRDYCRCGHWEIYFGGSEVKTDYGYPVWNTSEEVGMEVATSVESANWGHEEVQSIEPFLTQPPTDEEYRTAFMSGTGRHSEPEGEPAVCQVRDPESPYWGNIDFATCRYGAARAAVRRAAASKGSKAKTKVVAKAYAENEGITPSSITVLEQGANSPAIQRKMDAGTAEKTYVAVITAPEGRRFNAKRLMKGRKPPVGEFAIIEVQDEFITGEYVGGVDGMREELPGIANAAEKAITEQRAVEAGEREKEAEKRKREEEAKKKEEEVRKHREEEPQKQREAEELKELKTVTKRYRALVEKHEETCGAKPEAAECVGSGLQRYQKEVDELELKMYEIETRCKTCLEWVTGQAVASASAVDGALEGKLLGHWPLVTLVDPAPGERVPNPRWHWRIDARRAPHGAVVASTFTNGQGYYRLARLLPGSYWVTARKAHIAWVCEGRRVSVRSTVDYDFPCVRR